MKKIFIPMLAVIIVFIIAFATIQIAVDTKSVTINNENIKAYLNKNIVIKYNDKVQQFYDEKGNIVFPISYEGTTYLPVRAMSSLLKIGISWDENSNSIYLDSKGTAGNYAKTIDSVDKQGTTVIDCILNRKIKTYFDSKVQTFKNVKDEVVYPISYNGTTYLPVRALSNLLKINIDWDGNTQTVIMSTGSQEIANGDNVRLDSTDILIACIDGDVLPSGTCAEIGKFHEKIARGDNKYIIGVCTDTRQCFLTHSAAKDSGGASSLGEQLYSYQNLYVTGLIK